MADNDEKKSSSDSSETPDPIWPTKERLLELLDETLELQRRGILEPPPPDMPDNYLEMLAYQAAIDSEKEPD